MGTLDSGEEDKPGRPAGLDGKMLGGQVQVGSGGSTAAKPGLHQVGTPYAHERPIILPDFASGPLLHRPGRISIHLTGLSWLLQHLQYFPDSDYARVLVFVLAAQRLLRQAQHFVISNFLILGFFVAVVWALKYPSLGQAVGSIRWHVRIVPFLNNCMVSKGTIGR